MSDAITIVDEDGLILGHVLPKTADQPARLVPYHEPKGTPAMPEQAHACPTCGQSVPSLGERLRACRTAPNWTRAEVAERIGVTPGRLMLWEEDKALPRPADVEALAELFERPPAFFAVTHNEAN